MQESKETTTLTREGEEVFFDSMTSKIDGEKNGNKYEHDQLSENCSEKQINTLYNTKEEINYNLEESDDSVQVGSLFYFLDIKIV